MNYDYDEHGVPWDLDTPAPAIVPAPINPFTVLFICGVLLEALWRFL